MNYYTTSFGCQIINPIAEGIDYITFAGPHIKGTPVYEYLKSSLNASVGVYTQLQESIHKQHRHLLWGPLNYDTLSQLKTRLKEVQNEINQINKDLVNLQTKGFFYKGLPYSLPKELTLV